MTTVRRLSIADGDAGTAQTVAYMADLIREGALTPQIRNFAVPLVSDIAGDDPIQQITVLRDWLTDHFRFVRDPASGELLHSPKRMMAELNRDGVAYGDCDDAAILGGALAASVGFHVALTTVAVLDSGVRNGYTGFVPYSHVWAAATPPFAFQDTDGQQIWFELDVTRPMQDIPVDRIVRAHSTIVC